MMLLKKHLTLLIVLVTSVVAILPFFNTGFFPIHDNTQVARVFEMHKSLSDGLFPVRWVADLGYGYGYPIFNFYAPFAYYVGALFMFLGFPALAATKFMIALGVLLAGVTMYYLGREVSSEWGGMGAAILYVFAPYHALNTYVRGAIGEVFAYAFIPLAILGFLKLAKKPTKAGFVIAVVGLAGVILSHNLTALIVAPFIIVEILILFFRKGAKSSRWALVIAFTASLVVSSWYWLPTLAEMHYTNVASQAGGGSDYKDHFVCISQLWSSQWGFAGSAPGCLDGLSFQLGKLHILFAVLAVGTGVLVTKKRRVLVFLVTAGLVISLFMMLEISKPVWDLFVFMKYLQFPWRFLQIALVFLSLLGGLFFEELRLMEKKLSIKHSALVMVIILILGTIFFNTKWFKPQIHQPHYPDQTKKADLNWTISKISDEYLPRNFRKPKSPLDVPSQPYQDSADVSVSVLTHSTKKLNLQTETRSDSHLKLNLAYFPAWAISIDSRKASYAVDHGIYDVAIPEGKHLLEASFIQTPIEKIANMISVIGIILMLIGIIRKRIPFIRDY